MKNDLSTYYKFRSYIAPCDILTWKGEGITQPVAYAIRAIRPSGYHDCNHISTVITSPQYAKRLMMMESTGKTGVVPIAISVKLESFPGKVWWHPMDKTVITFDQRIKMERWLWDEAAFKPYDFGDCFKQAFAYVSANAKAYFCSEMSSEAIRAGNDLSSIVPETAIQEEALEKFRKKLALRPWDVPALPIFSNAIRII